MDYLIIVSDKGTIIEKLVFTYRDEAIYFVERRRKQGYFVTIKSIELSEKEKNNGSN